MCNAESGCEVGCEYNNGAVPCADAERLALSSCYRHRDGDGCGLVGICHGVDLSSMRCDNPGEAARLACMGQWPSTTCVVDGTLGVCGEDGVCRAGERGLAACTGLTAGAACTDTSAGWPRSSHCIDTPLGPACAAVTSDPCDPRGIGERCGDSSQYSCGSTVTRFVACHRIIRCLKRVTSTVRHAVLLVTVSNTRRCAWNRACWVRPARGKSLAIRAVATVGR